ncbi:MAG: class I tRNA ligase family protein, partial [Verrucomicrobiales bacterium]
DFLRILNPFAPHLSEELNSLLGQEKLLSEQPWPTFDPALLVESEIEMVVQVNGKLRAKIMVPAEAAKEAIEEAALADEKVRTHTEGKTVRKVIVVPKKLVNIVAN